MKSLRALTARLLGTIDVDVEDEVEDADAMPSSGPPRTLLSLFDHSGEWSRPFAEAGWNVLQVDLKHGDDIRQFSAKWLLENVLQGYDTIDGILAAPPCTDFTVSAARHWKKQDATGSTACSIELVRQTLRTVDFLKPAFWAIENPAGRIAALVPGVGGRKMVWDPCDFAGWTSPTAKDLARLEKLRKKNLHAGDTFSKEDVDLVKRINAYTKRTVLYGDFNALQKRRIEPVNTSKWGSWLQSLGGKSAKTKELRSVTPAGFARAFYEANKNRRYVEDVEEKERSTRRPPTSATGKPPTTSARQATLVPATPRSTTPGFVVYGMPTATCTRKVLLALAEKGQEATFVLVDLAKGEHKQPAHLARQPFGRIPVLEHGSYRLYESRAILQYLDVILKGPSLTPASPEAMGLMAQWISVEYSYFAPAAQTIFMEILWGDRSQGDMAKVVEGRAGVAEALDVVDAWLGESGKPYLGGDAFSLGDICWMPGIENLFLCGQGDLIMSRAHVAAWWTRVSARPTWKKVLAAR
jgi:glutathione S-transferase